MARSKYYDIIAHYESCLDKFGDSHLGVDWPKEQDVDTRYRVMLDVVKKNDAGMVSLLDFGCGASHLYGYILRKKIQNIEYSGLDISEKFIKLSREKYPAISYYCLDVLNNHMELPDFDYIVMNGVFTEKCDLSFNEMLKYFKRLIIKIFSKARIGVAFNAMSSHVDREREDLFHLPIEILTNFLVKHLSRNFVIRNDYGLYEYTTYIYRKP